MQRMNGRERKTKFVKRTLIDVSRWTTQRVPVKVNTTHKTSLHRSLQAGSKVFGFSLTIPFPNTAAEFMRSLFRALCSHDAAP